ncbi:hypothetical protein pipiens_015118 [Culex pipiens pipiens]|uniref:RNase H type-1 domain-containing protein n=1 Tax=Culex pipiens pipiens TaxID=38569 RepID=A0ABD1CRU8_CULPP
MVPMGGQWDGGGLCRAGGGCASDSIGPPRWEAQQCITVKNQVDVEELDRELADKSIKIKWYHVVVDCGILGNERADALARES